jgi:hypothetical protein
MAVSTGTSESYEKKNKIRNSDLSNCKLKKMMVCDESNDYKKKRTTWENEADKKNKASGREIGSVTLSRCKNIIGSSVFH